MSEPRLHHLERQLKPAVDAPADAQALNDAGAVIDTTSSGAS
jgi:hypothetical protein